MDINDNLVNILLTQIEVERRRKLADFENGQDFKYIDPDNNVQKVKIYNNNIIEARRGCGKTSLILKSIEDNNEITVKCDCQSIRNQSAEDIVLSLLEKLVKEVKIQAQNNLVEMEESYNNLIKGFPGILKKWFSKYVKETKKKLLNVKAYYDYVCSIEERVKNVRKIPEERDITFSVNQTSSSSKNRRIQMTRNLKTSGKITIGNEVNFATLATEISAENNLLIECSEESKVEQSNSSSSTYIKKILRKEQIDKLKQLIIELLKFNKKNTGKGTMLFLDDFYQIERNNHPYVIQFFHDIFKETATGTFCYKIVSLPSALKINNDGETIFSLKDDFSVIPLDYDLSELDNVQNHLVDTLIALDKENRINRGDIIRLFSNDDTLKYLVIATGGIPRDFLTSFSEAVRISISEGKKHITKDQVYSVIKILREDKEKNYEADSDIPIDKIEEAVEILTKEVVLKMKTSVILYPVDKAEQHEILLRNLVNLRYLHLIKDKITSEKTKGTCKAYLIDMTFYACSRMQGNFDFCRFWERNPTSRHLDNLRRSPIWSFSDTEFNKIIQK